MKKKMPDRIFILISVIYVIVYCMVPGQAMEDTGCRSNRDCVIKTGRCYLGTDDNNNVGMCGCKNGLSNYPLCESQRRNVDANKCDEDCSVGNGKCSADGTCMCSFGGLWPKTCCRGLCPLGQSCYMGQCECMYGELPNGECTRCKNPCGELEECNESRKNAQCQCKYGGTWPRCKENDLRDECNKHCGPESSCRKDNSGNYICTKCGPGRKLSKRRCYYLGEWQEWARCSVTCGTGVQIRRKSCKKTPCYRERRRRKCDTQKECYEEWLPWEPWTDCSRTCGIGFQKRFRSCPSQDGCGPKESKQMQECHMHECPIIPKMSDWGAWSKCNQCGKGVSTRHRSCLTAPAIPCKEEQSEGRICAACETWSQWSTCSRTCGTGDKNRFRKCPSEDGCGSEITKDSEKCEMRRCPSKISDWGQWSGCKQCGKGVSTRKRSCLSAPAIACKENMTDQRNCAACETWGHWSACSRTCGAGNKKRTRKCPSIDGCGSEKTQDSINCELKKCPSRIGKWGAWSECKQCGRGVSTRKRSCLSAPAVTCAENLIDKRDCAACEPWGKWSKCTGSCGTGTRKRSRICSSKDKCGSEKTEDSEKCQLKICKLIDPFGEVPTNPSIGKLNDPFGEVNTNPFKGKLNDPFGNVNINAFKGKLNDPFGKVNINAFKGKLNDPFGKVNTNPFKGKLNDPFGKVNTNSFKGKLNDPFGKVNTNAFKGKLNDPFGKVNTSPFQSLTPFKTPFKSFGGQLNINNNKWRK